MSSSRNNLKDFEIQDERPKEEYMPKKQQPLKIYLLQGIEEEQFKQIKIQLMRHQNNEKKQSKIKYSDFTNIDWVYPLNSQIRLYCFDCLKEDEDQQNFQIRLQYKTNLFSYDYYEKYGYFRPYLQNHQNIQFTFGLKIVPNGIHIFNKQPPGSSVSDPIEELCCYLTYIFDFQNYFDIIPLLLDQYHEYYKSNKMKMISQKQLNYIINFINTKILNQSGEENNKLVFCLLGILGILFLNRGEFEDMNLNSQQDLLMYIQVNSQQIWSELSQTNLKDVLLNGFINLIIIDYKQKGNIWNNLLQSIPDEQTKYEILSQFFNGIKNINIIIQDSDIDTLYELIQIQNSKLKFNLELTLIQIVSDFKLFLNLFMAIYSKPQDYEDIEFIQDNKDMINEINITYKEQFVNTINNFLNNQILTYEKLKNIIQDVFAAPPEIKEIFYYSDLPVKIKEIMSGIRKFDSTILNIIGEIFYNYYDPFILQNLDRTIFLDRLLEFEDLNFGTIYNNILILDSQIDLKKSFQKWLSKFENNYQFTISEYLNILDKNISQIQDENILDILSQFAVSAFEKFSKQKYKDLIDSAKLFDHLQIKQIQEKYIQIVYNQVLEFKSLSNSNKNPFQRLVIQEKSSRSETRQILINKLLGVMKFENHTFEDLTKRIILEPSEDDFLYILLLNQQHYPRQEFIIQIIKQISLIGMSIIEKNIKIEYLLIIKNYDSKENKVFNFYIKKTLELNKIILENSFSEILKNILHNLNQIVELINELSKLFQTLRGQVMDIDNVLNQFQEITHNYNQKTLNQLVFPEQIEKFILIVRNCGNFTDCKLSNNLLNQEIACVIKSNVEVNTANIFGICSQAHAKIQTELEEMLIKSDQYSVNKFFLNFQNLQNVQTEINLLEKYIKADIKNKIKLLESYLDCLFLKEIRYEVCKSLVNIQKLIHFQDIQAIELCQNYIQFCDNISDNLSLKQFSVLSTQAEKIIFLKLLKDKSGGLINVINQIPLCDDLVEFVKVLKEDEIEYLKEGVNEFDESFVNTQVILDLGIIWTFFTEVTKETYTFETLIRSISSKIMNPKYKNIISQLKNCQTQLNAVKDLHKELNCKEEVKNKQIIEICKDSIFKFHKISKKEFNIQLQYLKNPKHSFNLSNLMELRDRAQLIVHTGNNQASSHETEHQEYENIKVFSCFVELVSVIQNTIENLNNLFEYGYPNIEIPLNNLTVKDGSYKELTNFHEKIQKILIEWENDLLQAYQENYWLTFLYGTQFWLLEQILFDRNKSQTKFQKGQNLLKFMGKDVDNMQELEFEIDQTIPIYRRLINLNQYIQQIPNMTCDYINFHYEVKKAHKIVKKNFGNIFYLESIKTLNGLVSLYINSDYRFPRIDQVFYCRTSTQWRELLPFIYRCFLNSQNELYIIISHENLTQEIQDKLIKLFDHLYNIRVGDRKFNLGLITSSSSCLISEYFKQQEFTNIVRDNKLFDDNELSYFISQIDQSTQVFTSEIVGLGKSMVIKQNSIQHNQDLIIFPISGQINLKSIGKQLQKINFTKNTILNIHLSFVDNYIDLNDLLISLSLFRAFCFTNNLFFIPQHCNLQIEVANTFENYLINQLPFLKYLKTHNIQELNLKNLLLSEDVNDPFNFISKYLQIYDQNTIDTIDLTELKMEKLQKNQIIYLIEKYFIQKQKEKGQDVTYTQTTIFVQVLHKLLKNFENCYFFTVSCIQSFIQDMQANGLSDIAVEYNNLRKIIFESLLITTEEFTTKSIQNVKKFQELNSNSLHQIENFDIKFEQNFQCNLSWESSNHFNMIFIEDGSLIPIYRHVEQVPVNFKKLLFLQGNSYKYDGAALASRIKENSYTIDEYTSMTHEELLSKLDTYNRTGQDLRISCKNTDYVLTPDNFLKMNLIYLRVQSGLPVIIMGETGCGKTSLIKFFVQNVLHQYLKVVSIHAGTTSKDIEKLIIEITQIVELIEHQQKLWIFFDEFNTSDCIGELCQIMCKRMYKGQNLPDNIAFLGACNPYRVKSRQLNFDENVGIKKYNKNNSQIDSKLIHIVKPLPDTMIEYIWDFGQLTNHDTKRYVFTMLNKLKTKNKDLFTDMICYAHKYFHEKEDVSSVSLRDVSRFIILYSWFKESIKTRQNIKQSKIYQQNIQNYQLKNHKVLDHILGIDITCGILAFCHCYYLRISLQSERNNFLYNLTNICQEKNLSLNQIHSIINREQNDYLARMELPKGTALNNALKENIFTMIPCVVNKIPVFICGKPGCSKSLSVSLLFTHLRGQKSTDYYFQTLPELTMVSFQGSDSCTSEGILKAFERAEKYLKTDSKNLLPVVVFDEIGLAEISKYNPLKVLHSLLEIENRKVSFIGISNWKLDASKMNRALYLARPDPDEDDLIYTAMSIYQSYSQAKVLNFQNIIENLAKSYQKLKLFYKNTSYSDFYGLRDFYHLIKKVSIGLSELNEYTEINIISIVKSAIQKNFGGKLKAANQLGEIFSDFQNIQGTYNLIPDLNIFDLIKENLNDKNARYLMIICRADVAQFILDRYLNQSVIDRRVIAGSNFERDRNQVDYGFRALSDIILYMERGISIILKEMDHIYSSLYDLFNQNFSVLGERRYCKVALGALFNPRCFVHQNFHAIIFLDDIDSLILQSDAPFLNRFEKHYIKLYEMLTEDQAKLVQELEQWILLIFKIQKSINLQLTQNNIFPIYNKEALTLLVLIHSSYGLSSDQIIFKCQQELLREASTDILILAEISSLEREQKKFLQNIYNDLHLKNFEQILVEMIESLKESNYQNQFILLTYDQHIFEFNSYIYKDQRIDYKKISNFQSEQDLKKDISAFLQADQQSLYILDLDLLKEGQFLEIIKQQIDNLRLEFKQVNQQMLKIFSIIIRMSRNIRQENSINLYEKWQYIFVQDLTQQKLEITQDFLQKTTKELIENYLIKFRDVICTLTERCLLKLKFQEDSVFDKQALNNHMFYIVDNIQKNDQLIQAISLKIKELLIQDSIKIKDWKELIFSDADIVSSSRDLRTAINLSIEKELEIRYSKIIYILEKESAFKSFFTEYESEIGLNIRNLWIDVFNNIQINKIVLQRINQSIEIKQGYDYDFPFILSEYDILQEIYAQLEEYEQFSDNNQIMSSLEFFAEQYQQKSKYQQNMEFIKYNQRIQEIYFRDLLKVCLFKNLQQDTYLDIIYYVCQQILANCQYFYEKIFTFLKHVELFQIISSIFDSYQIFSDQNIKQKILNTIEQNSNLQGQNSLQDNLQIEDEINSNKKFEEENYSQIRDWQQDIGSIFQQIISDILPNERITNKFQNKLEFYLKIKELSNKFYELNEYVKINNFDILDFWVGYIQLQIKINDCSNNFQDIFELAHNFKGEYFQTDENLFSLLENQLNQINDKKLIEPLFQFRNIYFKILLRFSDKFLEKILEQIIKNTEFYRHYYSLLEIIIEKSQILQLLDLLEQCNLNQENSQQFEYADNQFLITIENLLKLNGVDSNFGIFLGDMIAKYCRIQQFNSYNDSSYLDYQLQQLNLEPKFYSCIRKLISCMLIRNYIDVYALIITQTQPGQEQPNILIKTINEYLLNNPLNKTLSLYCLKKCKQIKNYSSQELYSFIIQNRCNLTSLEDYIQIKKQNKLDFYPYIHELKDEYIQLVKDLLNQFDGQQDKMNIEKYIQQSTQPNQKIVLGLWFINAVFLQYLETDKINNNLIKWVKNNKQIISQYQGSYFANLFENYVTNFPQAKNMQLNPNKSSREIQKILVMCFIITIIFAFGSQINPMTSIYFQDGRIPDNIDQVFNNMFIYGVENEPLHQSLISTLQNYNLSIHQGVYKCSDTCDFVYLIDGCGQPMSQSNCPFCKQIIGGLNHQIHQRQGHQLIAKDQVDITLKNLIYKYEINQTKGYKIVREGDTDQNLTYRGLQPITFRLLHLILHTSLYFFKNLDLLTINKFQLMITSQTENYDKFLLRHIGFDIKWIVDLLGDDEAYIWLFRIISKLPNILRNFNQIPSNSDIRIQFEKEVENQLVVPCLQSIITEINIYKNQLNNDINKNAAEINDLINELNINKYKFSQQYPLLQLFRIKGEVSFEKMVNAFSLCARKFDYAVLDIYFQNYQNFKRMKSLYPIIEFTNYLLDQFDHKITREEARHTPIKVFIDKDPKLNELFKQFLVAWDNLNLDQLQYDCHVLKVQSDQFNQKDFLINFLPDNKEQGGGMYMSAALRILGEQQNILLKKLYGSLGLQKEQQKTINEEIKYSIQGVQKQNILTFKIDDPIAVSLCSYNNVEYGKGKEINYDFERLQLNLIQDFPKKKYLNCLKINYIQYQFELLSMKGDNSSLIIEIAKNIPQQEFDKQTIINIDTIFKAFLINEKDNYQFVLKELLGSLNNILCFLKNSKEQPTNTIGDFCNKINSARISKYLQGRKTLANLKLTQIIKLYEFIEIKYFPFMLEQINPDFACEDYREEIKKQLKKLLNECDKYPDMYPQRIDVQYAMMRFILRCIQADLIPTHALMLYIFREDFWSTSIDQDKLTNLEQIFPANIELRHAKLTYSLIYEINSKINNSNLQSQNQKQVKLIQTTESHITLGKSFLTKKKGLR